MEKTPQPRCIIFFVKAPVQGAVKTRLAEHAGEQGALILYRAFASDILAALISTDLPLRIFYHPAGHHGLIKAWLGENLNFTAQQGDGLGERMYNAFCRTADEGFENIILVGSDIPELGKEIIKSAFSALQTHPAVIGPAHDGGYYLIGAGKSGIIRQAFTGIDWGTPRVFEKTLRRFREKNMEPGIISELRDIDTGEDLKALAEDICRNPEVSKHLKYTLAALKDLKII